MKADVIEAAEGLLERLEGFVERFLPHLQRVEQWRHFQTYLHGLLAPLKRKSIEPIANFEARDKRNLSHFVSESQWSDQALLSQLWNEMAAVIGDPMGVLTVDGSQFPKKGESSVGVARQYCGRLGKIENCQSGVFVGYVAPKGHQLAACRLYLPKEWAEDVARREGCHVPPEIPFQTSWQIARDLIREVGPALPHQFIVADEEFGRVDEFREQLAAAGEVYVVEVPSNRLVLDLAEPIGEAMPGESTSDGERAQQPWCSVAQWAQRHWHDAARWRLFVCRQGTQGPLRLWAAEAMVQTRSEHSPSPIERLIVSKVPGPNGPWKYWLSNAPATLDLKTVVTASTKRFFIEQDFQRAKGEVGLADYELRSWPGWHHHMTLCFLALWFLVLEQGQLEKKMRRGFR